MGVLVAVICAAVGFTLDTSEVTVSTADEAREASWPSPFEREIKAGEPRAPGGRLIRDSELIADRRRREALRAETTDGDARLWYFAAGAVLVLTLASLPLLRERDRRRPDRP